MNVLVLHWPTNTIVNGWTDVDTTQRLIIDHRYTGHQWSVMIVCPAIYGKWLELCSKHESVHVNHLVRVSKAFLKAVKNLSPRWRCNRMGLT